MIPDAVNALLRDAGVTLRWSASGPPTAFVATATLGPVMGDCPRGRRDGRGSTLRDATIGAVGSLRSYFVAESAEVGAAGDVMWGDLYAADAEKMRALVEALRGTWT